MRLPTLALLLSALGLAAAPTKVFILVGQSNMEGHARVETIDYIGEDPATAPLLKRMKGPTASRPKGRACGFRITPASARRTARASVS